MVHGSHRTHTNDINLIRLLEISAIHEIIYHILCGHIHFRRIYIFVFVVVLMDAVVISRKEKSSFQLDVLFIYLFFPLVFFLFLL